MNAVLIEAVLTYILSTVKVFVTSEAADNVIAILEGFLPTIVNEFSSLLPLVENIISTLKGSKVMTDAQIATVDAFNLSSDTQFDNAGSAA